MHPSRASTPACLLTVLPVAGSAFWIATGMDAPTTGTDRDPAAHPTFLSGEIGVPGERPALLGDLTNDGHVSGADLAVLLGGWTG